MRSLMLFAGVASVYATLYAFGIEKSTPKKETVAVASIDTVTGGIALTPSFKTFPSDAYCNVAFRTNPSTGHPEYLVPAYELNNKGYQSIITVDATSGNVTSNVTMSKPYGLPATAYDPASGSILAVGIPYPQGGVDIISVDPASGQVTVLYPQVGIPDIQLCEAVFGPKTSSYPSGLLYYLWQPLNESAVEVLVSFDLASQKAVSSVSYHGGLNGLALQVTTQGQEMILATSYLEGRPMDLVQMDPASGNYTVLTTMPQDGYVPFQGAQTFDPSSGVVYVAMGFNDPSNSSYYPVLVEFDTKADPVSIASHWLNETAAELWSLDWA